jgi:hypothetical protein
MSRPTGAAGFFGIPMQWRGLDDPEPMALCPIVVTPSHEVREIPRPGNCTTIGGASSGFSAGYSTRRSGATCSVPTC